MTGIGPAWIPCDACQDWWCLIHDAHVFECPCPPLDEWAEDPYLERPVQDPPSDNPSD